MDFLKLLLGRKESSFLHQGIEKKSSQNCYLHPEASFEQSAWNLQKTYRIFLVDDHQIVLDGISSLLRGQKNYQIIGTSTDPVLAFSQILEMEPDLVLTDIEMPKMSGIELSKALKLKRPDLKILALSMFQDYAHIQKMMEVGVQGYVLKSIGKEELGKALEAILSGKMYLSDEASEVFLHGKPAEHIPIRSKVILTPREIEIVRLIADELSNAEMAERLFISTQTVETHRKNIMRKTEAKTAMGLVNMAKENRWI